ncbi:hypothetical protein K504DRAFT_492363 [Pleomassaria siparia CBS 279.74]|uniref:Uncharacterized protein n=1 Tax=Pleomassaria siparia CBS 279.74 TaxID=1314801 RepID=A0A6G1K4I3_9PLEO|nr:hypothetical protein K504DRAFT_492363 [Pleomassaria siparia CBS 279.74]
MSRSASSLRPSSLGPNTPGNQAESQPDIDLCTMPSSHLVLESPLGGPTPSPANSNLHCPGPLFSPPDTPVSQGRNIVTSSPIPTPLPVNTRVDWSRCFNADEGWSTANSFETDRLSRSPTPDKSAEDPFDGIRAQTGVVTSDTEELDKEFVEARSEKNRENCLYVEDKVENERANDSTLWERDLGYIDEDAPNDDSDLNDNERVANSMLSEQDPGYVDEDDSNDDSDLHEVRDSFASEEGASSIVGGEDDYASGEDASSVSGDEDTPPPEENDYMAEDEGEYVDDSLAVANADTSYAVEPKYENEETIPAHRPRAIDNIIKVEREVTPEGAFKLNSGHKELEGEIEANRIEHEQNMEEDAFYKALSFGSGPSLTDMQDYADAFEFVSGIVVEDPDNVGKLFGGEETYAWSQASMENHPPSSRVASPASEEDAAPPIGARGSLFATLAASNDPNVIQTPNGMHVDFAKGSNVFETPFSTLDYFKTHRDKRNSPHKSRRNASLPDEIAELAKEAHATDSDQADKDSASENLDKYREQDLAPEDSDGLIFDLDFESEFIAPWTPNTKGDTMFEDEDVVTHKQLSEQMLMMHTPSSSRKTKTYKLDIPGHFDDSFHLEIYTNASTDQISEFIRQRGEELDASDECIAKAVESFLATPESFVVDKTPEHPTFIKVISMMPSCMFWATVKPVAHFSTLAFDAVLQKLTGFTLDGPTDS